jgi:hypothetical protein
MPAARLLLATDARASVAVGVSQLARLFVLLSELVGFWNSFWELLQIVSEISRVLSEQVGFWSGFWELLQIASEISRVLADLNLSLPRHLGLVLMFAK